jgi:dephospho-CoA kinase
MIVAIAGTNGAGKGTVADYLVSLGFKHFSAREFFVEEINKRGLIVNRDSMRLVANELRQTYGPDYNIRTLYERALAYGNNAVIESLRCPAETSFIINKPDTHFIGIDADPHIRYKRAMDRKSATDSVTFERFLSDEERESIGTELWDMNIPLCLAKAEKIFMNDGNLEKLHAEIDLWLETIGFKK